MTYLATVRNPWSVFEDLEGLQRQFNSLFSTSIGDWGSTGFPRMDVWVDEKGLTAELELPGVDPQQLDIALEGDELTIAGSREVPVVPKDGTLHLRERFSGQFARRVRLPFPAEADKVAAHYKHGVLTVNAPRAEASKPKKVLVATN